MRPLTFLLTLVASTLAAGAALACSCMRAESPAQHLSNVDLAFFGAPVAAQPVGRGEMETRFRVEESIKGRAPRTVTVRHRLESASCGLRFRPGERQLVLASRSERGGWTTSLCSQPQFSTAEYRRAADGRPGPGAGRCDARAARFALGQRYSPWLGERAREASGAATLRVRRPGEAHIQDLRTDRLNLDLNRNQRVVGIVCE
jgi:peptidase inhibitor I78 family protein